DRNSRMNLDTAIVGLQQQYLSRIERDPNSSLAKKTQLEIGIVADYPLRQMARFESAPENAEFLKQNPEIQQEVDKLQRMLEAVQNRGEFGPNYARAIDKQAESLKTAIHKLPQRKYQDEKGPLLDTVSHIQSATSTMKDAKTIREGSQQLKDASQAL